MRAAIEELLAGSDRRAALGTIAERLQASPGTERAADLIERLALPREPVTRR